MIRPHWSGPPFGMAFEPGGRIDVEEESPARGDRGQAAAGEGASLAGRERRGGHSGDRRHRGRLRDELLDGEIFYSLLVECSPVKEGFHGAVLD